MSRSTQPTLQEQKQFWNWHWQHWQDRKTINNWKQRRHEAVIGVVKSVAGEGSLILDVGCGPGWYTESLASFGKVTGIDLSEEAIAMARSRFPNIQFVAGNIYDHVLPRGQFDIVVSQEVIDHVDDSELFVDCIADLLRPGGYVVLSCTNKFIVDRLNEREFPHQPASHIGRYFDTSTVKPLLRRRFRLIQMKTIIPIGHGGILRIVNSHKLNGFLSAFISRDLLDRLKEAAGFGYQIIVLAQRVP